jgi:hypothetical protein
MANTEGPGISLVESDSSTMQNVADQSFSTAAASASTTTTGFVGNSSALVQPAVAASDLEAVAPSPAIVPSQRRLIFISFSQMAPMLSCIPADVLESALFFFGSKQFWFMPTNPAEQEESLANGGHYLEAMATPGFAALFHAKSARDEICFLKPNTLGPVDCPGGVNGDYTAASAWLVRLGYPPLKLSPKDWAEHPRGKLVVRNFQQGLHSYDAVCELLQESVGAFLTPVLRYNGQKP